MERHWNLVGEGRVNRNDEDEEEEEDENEEEEKEDEDEGENRFLLHLFFLVHSASSISSHLLSSPLTRWSFGPCNWKKLPEIDKRAIGQ